MEGLQKTILVLVVLVLSAQLAHFAYLKFLQPTTSALDTELDSSIKSTTSLKELVAQFEKSEQEVQAYEDSLPPGENRQTHRRDMAPYESNRKLRAAIQVWEHRQAQIKRLVFQWTIGLLLALAGTALYLKRISWIGTALIIAGLAEMIWWCSPAISFGGANSELEKILNIKLILTLATAGVFSANWVTWGRTK